MAPRSTKAKKATDVKVADEVPKSKGKGKAKEEIVIEAKDELEENNETVPVTDKKSKRGGKRKVENTNGQEQVDDKSEEAAPAAKKGKKKKVEDSDADDASNDGSDKNGDIEANGETEQTEKPAGRGRNKAAKKEPAEPKEVKAGRGRKGKQEKSNGDADKQFVEEKPAAKKRGRKAEPKDDAEESKPEPAAKGRKKATKVVKELTPESDKEVENQEEEKIAEEPKKKEVKGRKGRGKKAKEEVEEEKDENEDEDKGMGDAKAEEDAEELQEPKPAKGKRAPKKRTADTPFADEPQDAQDTGEPKKKKRALSEDTKPAPLKNKSATDFDSLDFSNSSKNKQNKEWNFKIASWNVDGIRAWLNKGGLDYIKYEKPDILCLQETKCAKDKLPEEIANLPGYHAYWLGSEKDGYAGVGIYTTKLAMNVQYGLQDEELDSEGRIITAEYEHFYLICTYVPNAGRNLVTLPKRLKWNEEFRKYVKDLDKKKPVIICGDMNVSHQEIDLANPKTNKKNAGFTVEERTGMTDLLSDGFVDTFRHLYPDKTGAYTFWTYMKNSRSKNVGWRLDYFIVSERLLPSVCDSIMRDQVYGSDHCPISLFLHLSSADKPK